MASASFKAFGYPFQTANVRVSQDAGFNVQQAKAGSDYETDQDKLATLAKRKAVASQERMAATSFKSVTKKKRYIM